MNIEQLMPFVHTVATASSIAVSIYLYVRSADRRTIESMRNEQRDGDAALAGRIGGLASELRASAVRDAEFHTRLSVLETKMMHVPTHADLVGIRQEMRAMNETVAAIGERSETTQEMVHSIQRFLIEGRRP